jgi:hypothetical protein
MVEPQGGPRPGRADGKAVAVAERRETTMKASGDFRDPEWEPTEAEHAVLMEEFRRTVLWQKAMAAKGVKVLTLRLTPAEEHAAVARWWDEEGRLTGKESASP